MVVDLDANLPPTPRPAGKQDLPPIPRLPAIVPISLSDIAPSTKGPSSPLPPIPSSDSASALTLPPPETPFSPTSSGNVTPVSPDSPAREPKPKKQNPLVDLIQSERAYVDTLNGVIRKVAAAWSRSNLPPKQLDAVFRAVEGCYKANRGLLNKLDEIGPNPSSPKVLGDLLMRWVDDLDGPYTRYAQVYMSSFDNWEPIQNNMKLKGILIDFSQNTPRFFIDASSEDGMWTLDSLLALPRSRLKYYKRLYGRLLKSTSPGRSDYKLLLGANVKLEDLSAQLQLRADINPWDVLTLTNPNTGSFSDEVRSSSGSIPESVAPESAVTDVGSPRQVDTVFTPQQLDASIIEKTVSTADAVDIFTMRQRQVKLSLNPPGLPFTREVRVSCGVSLQFTPRVDGIERLEPNAHLFLLTDLLLICRQPNSKSNGSEKELSVPDHEWCLLFPPLAARHLSVSSTGVQTLEILVMKKEMLSMRTKDEETKVLLYQAFQNAIQHSQTSNRINPPANSPVAPRPAIDAFSLVSTGNLSHQLNTDQSKPILGLNPTSDTSMVTPSDLSFAFTHLNTSNSVTESRESLRSPPPPPPIAQQSVPQIMQPKPLALPSEIPAMFDGRDSPANTQSYYPISPAPPPQQHDLSLEMGSRPPPRGASMGLHTSRGIEYDHGRQSVSAPASENHFDGNDHHNRSVVTPSYPPRSASRASSGSFSQHSTLRKAPSSRSLNSFQRESTNQVAPPVPYRDVPGRQAVVARTGVPVLPSVAMRTSEAFTVGRHYNNDVSPPASPPPSLPVTSAIRTQMKCKVFLKQQHAQWKSLGAAVLKLYVQIPTNIKQLVVEAQAKDNPVLISTIVLTDGVERVGKTGVAIELSDKGQRTGIVYMIQTKNEQTASDLFNHLIAGSDRTSSHRPI